PPTFAMIDYDVPPPPPDEVVYIDRPVLMFSDPDFDFAPPPPMLFLPPPPADFVVLEPPSPPVGLFFLPSPLFVPIPAYVRAPAYVRPPQNDVIFTNIHNATVINNVINQPPLGGAPNPAAPNLTPGTKVRPADASVARPPGPGTGPTAVGPVLPSA